VARRDTAPIISGCGLNGQRPANASEKRAGAEGPPAGRRGPPETAARAQRALRLAVVLLVDVLDHLATSSWSSPSSDVSSMTAYVLGFLGRGLLALGDLHLFFLRRRHRCRHRGNAFRRRPPSAGAPSPTPPDRTPWPRISGRRSPPCRDRRIGRCMDWQGPASCPNRSSSRRVLPCGETKLGVGICHVQPPLSTRVDVGGGRFGPRRARRSVGAPRAGANPTHARTTFS